MPSCTEISGSKEATAPPRGADPVVLPTRESTIVVPIAVELDALRASIEEDLDQELVNDEGVEVREGISADILVTRAGEVGLVVDGDRLHIQVPLSIAAEVVAAPKVSLGVLDRSRKASVTGAATIHIRVAPSLDSSWDMLATRAEVDTTWDTEPRVEIGPFKFKITKKIEAAIEEKYPEITNRVQERMRARSQSREKVAAAWAKFADPTPLGEVEGMWLTVTPSSLYATDLAVRPDQLALDVGLRGTFSVVSGPRPPARDPGPVPPRTDPPEDSGFALYVPVALTYDMLTEALGEQLATLDLTLPAPGFDKPVPVQLSDAIVYPSGKSLVVGLDFAADPPGTALDLSGRLYVQGVPHVDRQTRVLHIREPAFDAATDSMLVNAADWLLHERLLDAVADRLELPIGERLDQQLGQANQRLSALGPTDGTQFDASLDAIAIRDVHLTETAVVVDASATGTASVRIDEIAPPD